ncbi:serine hydrolase domain-containing protein [Shouchella sp. 1P09AA]|uniref:serine hydrolase domain-containing protein n=1 Tax=unclassified Shouchella TaxID=2893065 RepID=UPI0039A274A1
MTLTAFEPHATSLLETFQTPGAIVALSNPTYQRSFGYRNVEEKHLINEETIFGIGSITKVMTCMAIMKLQEEGKLSVRDVVHKHVPEFSISNQESMKRITIHHLMTHTSGLPPLDTLFYANKSSISMEEFKSIDDQLDVDAPSIDTENQFFAHLHTSSFQLLGKPGERFSYSNDGYAILGTIIERVSGQSYDAYMKEAIFIPADMKRSFFSREKLADDANVTQLYTMEPDGEGVKIEASPTWWDAPTMWAAGYVKSTAKDMLRFANQLMSQSATILSKNSLEALTATHVEIEPGLHYGYGLMIHTDFFGKRMIQHGGGIKGVSAQLSILPDENIAGICLTNIAGAPANPLLQAALKEMIGEKPETPSAHYEDVTLSSTEKLEMTGTYQANEGQSLEIVEKEGELSIILEGNNLPARTVGTTMLAVHLYGEDRLLIFNKPYLQFGYRQLQKV